MIARNYNIKFENFYATVIQQAYRNYKKRPESLAKQVWEVVRNDGTPNEKKFLGVKNELRQGQLGYICRGDWDERCCHPVRNDWMYEKVDQL